MRQPLIIRREQMRALGESSARAFERRLLRYLLERPGQPLPEPQLARQLPLIITRGKRFFTTEADIARYAEIVVLVLGGLTTEDHPEKALRLLQPRSVPASRRLDNFSIWATAERNGGGHGRRHVRHSDDR